MHLTATATAPPSSRFPRLKIKVITHRRHRRRLLKERAQRCLKGEARRFRRWGSGSADEVCMNRPHLITALQLQGWAKLPFLGCQNASGKMMVHKWFARAEAKFYKPGRKTSAHPFTCKWFHDRTVTKWEKNIYMVFSTRHCMQSSECQDHIISSVNACNLPDIVQWKRIWSSHLRLNFCVFSDSLAVASLLIRYSIATR